MCNTIESHITMDRYKETFETWNKVASLYEDKFMELDLYNDSYDLFCNTIPKKGAKILEIGCGPGNITKYLLAKRPDFDLFGIDVAPNMIALAQKNNPNAQFAVMDCRAIEKIQSKYDGIVCGFCLPYLSDADCKKCIADCGVILEENGLIYISFVEGDPNQSNYQMGSSGDRMFFYYYELEDLKTRLIENNFTEIKVSKVPYKKAAKEIEMHTIITAKKKTTVI